MIELAVFVSGGGTNCENIIRYFSGSDRVHVALVIANKPGIPALEKADRLGVPTRVLPKADLNREDVLLPLMREYSIDFIVLAGFLLVIPDFLIREYDPPFCQSSAAWGCMAIMSMRRSRLPARRRPE